MNPDLYTLLPPEKKEEYIKSCSEPIVLQAIMIDDSVPKGYARFGDQMIKLPEAQTYTNIKDEPLSLDYLKQIHEDMNRELIERDDENGIVYLYSGFNLVGLKFR
jgi:hypothetical protein